MSDLAVKLLAELSRESAPGRYVVALSGGLDSIVLLHALASLRDADSLHAELAAVHINHQLSDMAMEWQAFCAEICQQWQVPLTTREVAVSADGSLEAAARAARYDAFRDLVQGGDSLLLAHHLDDQIETFLYRLLRGAGPQGLSGIPRMRGLGEATLWRPLLEFTRAELHTYAVAKGLQWKEDESNQDDRHDRNFLRHHVFPVLEGRWPDYRASWLKSLNLMVGKQRASKRTGRSGSGLAPFAAGRLVDGSSRTAESGPSAKCNTSLGKAAWASGLGLANYPSAG